jgi:hypothetical protein
VKKRGSQGDSFDDTVSRSEFLRAFGKLAVYAAPAVLIATAGCGDDVGGGGSDDDDCSVSSVSVGSLESVSCSSSSSSSEECVPGDTNCNGVAT